MTTIVFQSSICLNIHQKCNSTTLSSILFLGPRFCADHRRVLYILFSYNGALNSASDTNCIHTLVKRRGRYWSLPPVLLSIVLLFLLISVIGWSSVLDLMHMIILRCLYHTNTEYSTHRILRALV